jgi:hypothetical protein
MPNEKGQHHVPQACVDKCCFWMEDHMKYCFLYACPRDMWKLYAECPAIIPGSQWRYIDDHTLEVEFR